MNLLTLLNDIKGEQLCSANFTVPTAKLSKSCIIHMDAGHFLPELVKVTHCRSQETYTVIQAIQVSINRLTFPLPNVTQALGNRYQGLGEQAIGEKRRASISLPPNT